MPNFDDWYEALAEPPRQVGGVDVTASTGAGRYAQAALGYEVTQLLGAGEGERNHRLNQAAFAMGQLVAAGEIDESAVRGTLTMAGRGIGLTETEITATIESGLRAGAQKPREARPERGGLSLVPEATEWHDGPGEGSVAPAEATTAVQPPAAHTDDSNSWDRIDLTPFLDGSYVPTKPTLMVRADGQALIYPSLVHSIHGESESGKSMIAQAELANLICAGRPCTLIDWESDPGAVTGRLLMFGAEPTSIAKLLDYRRPDGKPNQFAWETLVDSRTDLVVLDGITEALSTLGKSTNDNDDIAWFIRNIPKRIADATGAAVILVDHVVKNAENRGRFAIGGQHKMNAVDGAAYVVEVVRPLGIGMVGELTMRIAKDRPGLIRAACGKYRPEDRTQEAARFILDSSRDGQMGGFFEPPETEQQATQRNTERLRRNMQRVFDCVEANPDINSTAIWDNLAGTRKGSAVTDNLKPALEALIREGYVHPRAGKGNMVMHRTIKPYDITEDPRARGFAPVTEYHEDAS